MAQKHVVGHVLVLVLVIPRYRIVATWAWLAVVATTSSCHPSW